MLSRTPQGQDHRSSPFGIFLDSAHEPLPLADVNLHPFPVINHNRECKFSLGAVSRPSELRPEDGLGNNPHPAPNLRLAAEARADGAPSSWAAD